MLLDLNIRNLALLEKAQLTFDEGFTVVTGQTGAGKSVLLSAIGLLSGAKTDKTIISKNAQSCEVEGVLFFKNTQKIDAVLASVGLPLCEEGKLIIKRCIIRDKGTKIWVNGGATTVSVLEKIGEIWVDFHGPGESQKLLSQSYQLDIIDAFSEQDEVKKQYQATYKQWQTALKSKIFLEKEEMLSEDERLFLEAQLEKMESIGLSPEGIDSLENDFNKITKLGDIQELSSSLIEGMVGDNGVIDTLRETLKKSSDLGRLGVHSAQDIAERLQSVLIECEDLARESESIHQSLDMDPDSIQNIHTRMHLWQEARRKYGPKTEDVFLKIKALKHKLEAQGDIEGQIYKLEAQSKQLEQIVCNLADTITQFRIQSSQQLSLQAIELLKQLGFEKPRLSIEVLLEKELSLHGNSKICILFAANMGQDLLPLQKIASSGEMARVMLALKALLAKVDATPLLIFDEVDANVGGEVGLAVAKELACLSQNHQVLCVTHLPQVAAQANQHFVVKKEQTHSGTQVTILPIHNYKKERIQELARMLGDRESLTALKHAEELVEAII